MKTVLSSLAMAALVAVIAVPGMAGGQTGEKNLTGLDVKNMIVNMGYSTKDLVTDPGKEKTEFMIEKGGYNVWMAAEVSPSKRYIWLTSFLGKANEFSDFNTRAPKILAANAKIQPCQFYTTESGSFMMAIAVDNRDVDPATLRFRMEKLAQDVAENAELWKK